VAFGFYNASVAAAKAYAGTLMSMVDLYRGALLEQLGIKRPHTLVDEKQIWQRLNEGMLDPTKAADPPARPPTRWQRIFNYLRGSKESEHGP
jgi:hypothetical protein